MIPTEPRVEGKPAAGATPNAWAAIGFAIVVAVLWMATLSGAGSKPTAILVLIFFLVGLPLSTRYSLATLRGLDRHKSGSTSGRRVRKAVVLLALLLNAWVILMAGGYLLIVIFSILNGGPIVATSGIEAPVSRR